MAVGQKAQKWGNVRRRGLKKTVSKQRGKPVGLEEKSHAWPAHQLKHACNRTQVPQLKRLTYLLLFEQWLDFVRRISVQISATLRIKSHLSRRWSKESAQPVIQLLFRPTSTWQKTKSQDTRGGGRQLTVAITCQFLPPPQSLLLSPERKKDRLGCWPRGAKVEGECGGGWEFKNEPQTAQNPALLKEKNPRSSVNNQSTKPRR